MTPSPQHCEYETQCIFKIYSVGDYVCNREKCGFDTRSRPSPAPTNVLAIPCPKCGAWTFRANIDEGYRILCSNDECKWQQKIVAEHDAAIVAATRKDERDKVLDELVYWMYDCPFGGKENSDKSHKILAVKINSLRTPSAPEQEDRR